MQAKDCELWITEAFDQIPWDSSPMLARLRKHYGEGFMQRFKDMVLLPLLGYTSIREAEEDLPYRRDNLYEWLKLEEVELVGHGGGDHVHSVLLLVGVWAES